MPKNATKKLSNDKIRLPGAKNTKKGTKKKTKATPKNSKSRTTKTKTNLTQTQSSKSITIDSVKLIKQKTLLQQQLQKSQPKQKQHYQQRSSSEYYKNTFQHIYFGSEEEQEDRNNKGDNLKNSKINNLNKKAVKVAGEKDLNTAREGIIIYKNFIANISSSEEDKDNKKRSKSKILSVSVAAPAKKITTTTPSKVTKTKDLLEKSSLKVRKAKNLKEYQFNIKVPIESGCKKKNSKKNTSKTTILKTTTAIVTATSKTPTSTTASTVITSAQLPKNNYQHILTVETYHNNRNKSLSLSASVTGSAANRLQKSQKWEKAAKKVIKLNKENSDCSAFSEWSILDANYLNKIESIDFDEVEENKTLQKRKRAYNSNSGTSIREQKLTKNKNRKLTTVTNNSKNRLNTSMSLYDRRYQTDDGRGLVTNGYHNATRNSSGSSSSALHNADSDNQDVTSNQYYTSPSQTALSNGGISNISQAPSMATLCNIGNTCYLNSVVYTLRFAPQFLHNLHHLIVDLTSIQLMIVRQRSKSSSLGRGITSAQMENARSWSSKDLVSLEQYNSPGSGNNLFQKSSHQLLTEKLHELYQSLHHNEMAESTEPFHADTLLHAIQDVNTLFEGNQQQDAHEFLMCVLNSIRETCQTLIKSIADNPEVIINGCIFNAEEIDSSRNEKDNNSQSNYLHSGGAGGNGSSSLSTKASFFSRKSKRKDEGKNLKNLRLQSPLKDGGNSIPQQQVTANSLFYLNTVDLSGVNMQLHANSTPTAKGPNIVSSKSGNGGNGNIEDELTPSSILKDKERLAEKIRELGLDFFKEDFEGVTVSTTKCLSCETITEQKESMINISVPVPISGYDSTEYMDKPCSFIQNACITREYFRGENKYRCEQCTGYTEAIRSISYEVLPRLLVIQLSRFSGGMEKINSYIPTSFTLQCFCSKCCELSDANKLHIYKLYSVITHVGATMCVGHYIAYTCSLDWANEYVNCPKDRRTIFPNQQQQQQPSSGSYFPINGTNIGGSGNSLIGGNERTQISTQSSSAVSAAASALVSSGLMKKMKFGRSKASSSGDMSKNIKNLNGITSKTITNGISRMSINTTCYSLNCCATRLCGVQQQQQLHQQQLNSQYTNTSDYNTEESIQNSSNYNVAPNTSISNFNNVSSSYGSTGRSSKNNYTSYASSSVANSNEPIWYMCDDDKIKAMTQREFEELLSPSRKITITPYLLFYARFDLQQSQPTPSKQTPQTSWSNESLQSGAGLGGSGNSIATAGMLHKM